MKYFLFSLPQVGSENLLGSVFFKKKIFLFLVMKYTMGKLVPKHLWGVHNASAGKGGGEKDKHLLPPLANATPPAADLQEGGPKTPLPPISGHAFHGSGPLRWVLGLGGGCRLFSGWYPLAPTILTVSSSIGSFRKTELMGKPCSMGRALSVGVRCC